VPLQLGEIVERIDAVEFALSKVYAGAPGAWPLWVTVTRSREPPVPLHTSACGGVSFPA
jgi:hypothetical protein